MWNVLCNEGYIGNVMGDNWIYRYTMWWYVDIGETGMFLREIIGMLMEAYVSMILWLQRGAPVRYYC